MVSKKIIKDLRKNEKAKKVRRKFLKSVPNIIK
jgi:hypothetical protein